MFFHPRHEPAVTSSPSPFRLPSRLQLSLSLPELTLSLAFALTGQSPRAERPLLYLIRRLPLVSPSISILPSG